MMYRIRSSITNQQTVKSELWNENPLIFTFVPCILILSKLFIHQRMQMWSS